MKVGDLFFAFAGCGLGGMMEECLGYLPACPYTGHAMTRASSCADRGCAALNLGGASWFPRRLATP